jgi:hypothetical protein
MMRRAAEGFKFLDNRLIVRFKCSTIFLSNEAFRSSEIVFRNFIELLLLTIFLIAFL